MAEVFADDVGPSPDEKQFSISSASGLEFFTGVRWNEQCSAAVGLILVTLIELQLPSLSSDQHARKTSPY